MSDTAYRLMARLSLLLCFGIVVLGAFVRLSDAGLGCPDWPGCYGQILVPEEATEVAAANEAYPERPVEAGKAWKEMIHRYFASSLGLLIIALAVFGWNRGLPRSLLGGVVALVIFQGILGMWTVTWQLKPAAVTAHLLGGMSTLAVLLCINLLLSPPGALSKLMVPARKLAALGLIVLILQIFLGGWTSSNYAALACPDLPKCHNQWWPETDFEEAFVLWRGLGVNYEYGILDSPARTAIHLTHRIGAVITTVVLLLLLHQLLRLGARGPAYGLGAALLLQISLGLASVKFGLPLLVAAAHNGGAAILTMVLTAINLQIWRGSRAA